MFKAREYITGFTGSAGTAVVSKTEARLWTDGRYFIQAAKQLEGTTVELMKMGQPGVPKIGEYLETALAEGENVGFDGRVVSVTEGEEYEKIAWVLTNLLSNAIRYSPENGHVVIGAHQTDDNYIEMYVQDFGKGIDPRYHKSIFDHYFRVPGTKVQGSGLGLSISRDFVEAHNGTLTVQSELGRGSKFIMRLKA